MAGNAFDPIVDDRARLAAELAVLTGADAGACARAVPQMQKALTSDRPDLRLLATVVAGRAGPAGLPVLEAAQAIDDLAIRQFATLGLARLAPDPGVVQALVRSAKDQDPTTREIALAALGRSGAAALDPLRQLIGDGDPGTSIGAMKALGQAARSTGLPVLEPGAARSHSDPLQALAAAEASVQGSGDPGRGLGDLIMKLEHADPAVRAEAATACGRLTDLARGAATALQRVVIDDPAAGARSAAATALAMIGAQVDGNVEALVLALRDSDDGVRRAVIIALAALEDNARPAVPALEALAETVEDKSDLEVVKAALMRIRGDMA